MAVQTRCWCRSLSRRRHVHVLGEGRLEGAEDAAERAGDALLHGQRDDGLEDSAGRPQDVAALPLQREEEGGDDEPDEERQLGGRGAHFFRWLMLAKSWSPIPKTWIADR